MSRKHPLSRWNRCPHACQDQPLDTQVYNRQQAGGLPLPGRLISSLLIVSTVVLVAVAYARSSGNNASASSVTSIDAGSAHTCVITTLDGMRCWGYNYAGQIGDGTTTDRPTAVDVTGLSSIPVDVSAGAGHTCIVTSQEGLKCWGDNAQGQLGDGTTDNRLSATDVSGLTSDVMAVSAGWFHTCAVTVSSGGAECWGQNAYGELGDATNDQREQPVDVTGLTSGVAAITTGDSFTCALTITGAVKCWGRNWEGQLGNGTTNAGSNTPVDVTGLGSGVVKVSGGASQLAQLRASAV